MALADRADGVVIRPRRDTAGVDMVSTATGSTGRATLEQSRAAAPTGWPNDSLPNVDVEADVERAIVDPATQEMRSAAHIDACATQLGGDSGHCVRDQLAKMKTSEGVGESRDEGRAATA